MSSLQTPEKQTDLRAVVDALAGHDRFLLTTHENPDGDALGSLVALTLTLRELGKDAEMYLFGDVPLPQEYRFMRLGIDHEALLDAAPRVVDIDHHHDNSRFGDVNLIVPDASSTGEILRDVIAQLGVELTPVIAEALYIAIVTDTGRFQYANTTARALRLAAELVEAGADVHRVFQGVYESVAFAKVKLLARALEHAEVLEGGGLIVSHLDKQDFVDAGAEEPFSEGIIDYLRAVEGAEMAAIIREPPTRNGPLRRISLRTTEERLDVSMIRGRFVHVTRSRDENASMNTCWLYRAEYVG